VLSVRVPAPVLVKVGAAVLVDVADGDVVAVGVERAGADQAEQLVGARPDAGDLQRAAGEEDLVGTATEALLGTGFEGAGVDGRVAGIGVVRGEREDAGAGLEQAARRAGRVGDGEAIVTPLAVSATTMIDPSAGPRKEPAPVMELLPPPAARMPLVVKNDPPVSVSGTVFILRVPTTTLPLRTAGMFIETFSVGVQADGFGSSV
jgi:hypothetical protein